MNSLFVDTNVFLYALDQNSKFHDLSRRILESPNNNLFTASKNLSELFAVTTKYKFDHTIVNRFYFEMKKNITILFANFKSLSIFELLLEKYKPIGNRVFDIELVSIMLLNNINRIATLNHKDFEHIDEVSIIHSVE